METVRDRLWMFSVEAGTDDRHFNVPISRITPIESCMYMNTPNLMMIYDKDSGPNPPFDAYFRALRPLKNVVWSIVGSGTVKGWGGGEEINIIRELAGRFPNLSGIYMDDFFNEETADGPGTFTLEELSDLHRRCILPDRTLDIWVVIYTHQLDLPLERQLQMMDVINLWTWHADDLVDLEENLTKVEQIAPGKRLSLGLYMWDYGYKRPIPLDLMKEQCRLGLEWLRAGRVESLVLLGSYLCDLDLEAVEWTRSWVEEVGEIPLG